MKAKNSFKGNLALKVKRKSNDNKLKIIINLLPVLIVGAFIFVAVMSFREYRNTKLSSSGACIDGEILSVPISSEEQEKLLTVVNRNMKLSKDYALDLEEFDNIKCDKILVDDLSNMIKKARQDGINLKLGKGYIDNLEQDEIYNKKVSEIMAAKSYTKVRAGTEANKLIARGGYSEYQTGLLIKFESDNSDFKLTNDYMWLNKNAVNYGFVLRYPENKKEQTGMSFDPSCYRYVGVDNAKRMRAMNMCLDEYLEYIMCQSI